jgi:ABC-type branched-subunit amino acid transport system substrate-binding protein
MTTQGGVRAIAGRARRGKFPTHAILALTIAVAVIVSLALAVALAPSRDKTAVIAVILPVEEEPYSHTAEIEYAMSMAADELNRWGGIGDVKIKVVVEEVAVDSGLAVSLFEQMEDEYNPLLYITMNCGLLATLSPLAEASQVPLIGMASAPGVTEGYEWVYRYFTSAASEVHSVMSLMEELNIGSVGVLYTISPHGNGIHDLLEEEFTAAGGTIQSIGCPSNETDFSDEVASLSANEAIYAVTSCDTLIPMLDAVAQNGYSGHVITGSCGSSPKMRVLAPVDPVLVAAPSLYRPENVYALDFAAQFEHAYNTSLTLHGAIAYDIVNLVHGLLEGSDVTRENLGTKLGDGFIFSGVLGTMRTSPGVHDFDVPVYPAIVSGGELAYL